MGKLDAVEIKWLEDKRKKGGKLTFAERNILNIINRKKAKKK